MSWNKPQLVKVEMKKQTLFLGGDKSTLFEGVPFVRCFTTIIDALSGIASR